ncbi:MAG: DUF2281 domain-containing protein [Deltaproteobacteria bacterium]|jgi:hypothetical protein|nr:DUF2281 domain-containing protein [Deltaproteobacteria bacterium]
MTTILKTIEIPENRRLNLELPADTPTGEVNISLTITPVQHSNTTKRPLSSFCGVFKNSPTFKGDPVEIQRKMRDEW